jgi:hypothetical protein
MMWHPREFFDSLHRRSRGEKGTEEVFAAESRRPGELLPENLRRPLSLALLSAILLVLPARLNALEQPLLRFVQWNDTHVDSSNSDYRLANEKMDYLVSSLNARTYFPVPNFVIGVGDMITGEGSGIPKLQADYALLQAKLAGLQCPFYPVVGNHDSIQQEGNLQYEAPYRAAFGADRVNYTFMAAGIEFIMLDDSGVPSSNNTAVGQARRDWLRGVLEASPNTPKIICCHIPLVPVRNAAVLNESFYWGSEIAHDDAMLDIVNAHSDKIIAVLSGHNHLTGVAQFGGISQIVVSGTASYPCDFACYEVFHDRIHVEMQSLPAELLTPDTDNFAPPTKSIAYTDAEHPTHYSFIAGSASERSFDIPLPIHLPEPSALALLTAGLIGLLAHAYWRHKCV